MKILAIILIGLLGVLSLGLLFVVLRFDPVPYELKIENYFNGSLPVAASVKNLSLNNRLPLGVKIAKIEFRDPQTNILLFKGRDVTLSFDLLSLLRGRASFKTLAIQQAEMHVNRLDPNENLWLLPAPLSHPDDKSIPPGKAEDLLPIPFKLSHISIHDMSLYLANEWDKRGWETLLKHIRLTAHQPPGELDYTIDGSLFDSSANANQYAFLARYHPGNSFINVHLWEINQHLIFKGILDFSLSNIQWKGVLNVIDIPVENFLSWLSDTPITDMRGKISIQAEGNFQGAHPKSLFARSQIRGSLDIVDGADFKQNVVQGIFREMAADFLPFQEFFYGDLPPEVNQLLHGDETPFQNIHADFRLSEGRWSTDDMRLKHYAYLIKLAGSYDFNHNEAHLEGRLVLLEKFTEYVVSKIYQMGVMRNERGRLAIPIVLEGSWPEFVIHPDMDYLFKQLEKAIGLDYRKKIQKQTQLYGEKK